MSKSKVLRPFRYSGNKARHLGYIQLPSATRLVEVCLGSGSVSVNLGSDYECIGSDVDERVVKLWHWLQSVTEDELRDLNGRFQSLKTHAHKPDIRNYKWNNEGEMLYVKLNTCGAYVGQWSSWSVYPQHRLPIKKTIAALPRMKEITVLHRSFMDYDYRPGDVVFFDPEYVGTSANYSKKAREKTPRMIRDFLDKNKHTPIVFTYGTDAPVLFPELNWQVGMERKVPRLRGGGTLDRTEYVCYINIGG